MQRMQPVAHASNAPSTADAKPRPRALLPLQVALRYDVYASLQPQARFLRLNEGGAHLAAAVAAFDDLDQLISALNWWVWHP